MSQLLLGAETADGIGASTPQLPLAPGSKYFGFVNPTDNLVSERTRVMAEEAAAEERKKKTDYWTGFKKAYQQNVGWAFDSNSVTEDMVDPNYVHDLAKHKKMLTDAGASPEHYDYFNQPIYSEKHAQMLVEKYKESKANDQYLADMGTAGSLAVNLAAGILDPISLGAGILTGGAAYAYKAYKLARMAEAGVVAARASKAATFAKGAAAGAVENMATELALSDKKPTWTTSDLAWAGVFGAGFGGGGALIGAALKAGSAPHLGSSEFAGENAAIHSIGDSIEVRSIREDVANGHYDVSDEIRAVINDPLQTDPVSEIGRRATEADTRLKQIESEIEAREAELKAIEAGMPTQKTPLVSEKDQLKDPRTDPKRDFTQHLPEKARMELAGMEAGSVFSDLRTPASPKGTAPEVKAGVAARKTSVEDMAKSLVKEFLPDQKLYLTSNNGVLSAKQTRNVYGVTVRLSDDTFQITIPNKHLKDNEVYSTLAHEIGHQVLNVNFFRAPAAVRRGIYEEYQKYLTEVRKMKDGKEAANTRFTADHAERTTLVTDSPAVELAGKYGKNYIFSFDEYMAERFAKYVEQKGDVSLPQSVREYFDAMIEKVKQLFGKVEGYLKPGTTVEQFFEDIRAGKYKDGKRVTDKELKTEAEKLAKQVEDLKTQLNGVKEQRAGYDSFLRSNTAAELAKAAPEAVMGNVRRDISGLLMTSKNPIVRRIGSLLVNEAVGLKNGAIQRMTAEEGQKLMQRQFETQFYRDFTPLFEQWKDKQKLSLRDSFGARRRFSEEVGRTILGVEPNPSAEAKQMAQTYSRLMVEYNQHINDVGKLEGKPLGGLRSEPVPDDPGYFTRLHDMEKWYEFLARHGEDNAIEFFKGSMMKANPWLNDKLAGKIAKTYVKKVQGMQLDEYRGFDAAFSGNDLDSLRKILDDQGLLTKGEIDDVVYQLKAMTGKDAGDSPANSRMKRRAMLDTSHEMQINGERVTLENFINTNAEEVFTTYNRQMSGAINMARVGIRTKEDFDKMILTVADSAKAIPGYADSYRMKAEIESLEFAYKRIMGIPTNPDNALTRVAGMFQKYNFIRLMNQMGLAQAQETANILGQMGLKTALKSIPSLATFIRDVKTGKLADNVMDELEVVLGHGTDILKGHNISERWMDEVGGYMNPTTNKVMNTVDTALNKGINATMMVSGFRAVNVTLQRWVSRALAQKFTDAAFGSDAVIKAEFRQMMGMDDAMYQRVLDQLKQHSSTEQGAIFGRKIKALNLNQWSDAEAAAAFTTGVFRWSRRMVQENDIGSMHRWMGTTAGQIITQFRSFVLNAWSKNTLWAVHNRNSEMAMSLVWGTALGSAIYAGRLYVNSIGREDREAYLEKYLSLDRVVINGISRTAQASLLPGLIDSTVAPLFLGEKLFDQSRSTGLSSSVLGNPTADVIDKISGFPKTLHDSIDGESGDQSAAAMRRSMSLLPWQNAIGIQQGLNVLAEGLAN